MSYLLAGRQEKICVNASVFSNAGILAYYSSIRQDSWVFGIEIYIKEFARFAIYQGFFRLKICGSVFVFTR